MTRDASACYWRGSELEGDVQAHAEALRGYANLARRDLEARVHLFADPDQLAPLLEAVEELPQPLRHGRTRAATHRSLNTAASSGRRTPLEGWSDARQSISQGP